MPHFFVDDGFSDSKEVLSIPARHRLPAVGLWTLCGAWCMAKLTDGFVPDEALARLGARPALVDALVAATLWERVPGGIRFTNWAKWQRTREQVASYRQWEADRKRAQRKRMKNAAASRNEEMSHRDSHGDDEKCPGGTPVTPVPVPEPIETYVGNEHSPNVGSNERGLSEPVTPSASRLVASLIPDRFPAAVRTALRLKASELMNRDQISGDDMADALRLWLSKPDAGPGLLPHLVAEAQRARTAPAANGRHRPTTNERVARVLAMKTPTDTKELEQ